MNDRSYKKPQSVLSSDSRIKLLALAQSAEITTDLVTNESDSLLSSESIVAPIEYNSPLTRMIVEQSSPEADNDDEQVMMTNRDSQSPNQLERSYRINHLPFWSKIQTDSLSNLGLTNTTENFNHGITRRIEYFNRLKAFYFGNKAKLWTLILSILVTTAILTCAIVLPPIPVLMSAVAVAGLTTATAQIIAAAMLSVVYTATSMLLGTILDRRRIARLDDIIFPVDDLNVTMPIATPVYRQVMTDRAARIVTQEQKQANPVSLSATSQTLFATPSSSVSDDSTLKSGTPITIGRSKAI